MPLVATQMDLEMIILREVSQTEKDRYHMTSLLCGTWKDETNEIIYKPETDSQTLKGN